MVVAEQFGEPTVLTTSKEDSHVQYDFGGFGYISIPEHNMWMKWESRMLSFYFFEDGEREHANFLYDYETNTLYGEAEFEYYVENFLQHYFEWNKDETKYSLDNLGNAAYEYVE